MANKHDCAREPQRACPLCAQDKLRALCPGMHLRLLPGRYLHPLTISGLRGSAEHPITIIGSTNTRPDWTRYEPQPGPDPASEAVMGTETSAEQFRPVANCLAARKQAAGEFPGLYYVADQAALYLHHCQHINIENLYFDKCWPTAIYLDDCQHISIDQCQFRWGTFAIGATGSDTRHLRIENCRWQQNPENRGKHWKTIPWHRIHGHVNNSASESDGGRVNIKKDYRHFDGDFISAWRIAGFVTIRNNLIEDAFNAIHFFNQQHEGNERLNRNIVIEDNWFVRVRDNAIEPEIAAWNWVIRHNVFVDVYSWFSFEMRRSGWFYIYGNLAWHTQSPGPGKTPPPGIEADKRTGGAVFKLPTAHIADGPTYLFHNSFHLRERFAKKKRLAGLKAFNNAIEFCRGKSGQCKQLQTLFANDGEALASPHTSWAAEAEIQRAEKNCFTRDWHSLRICFDANVISGPDSLEGLLSAGYPFGHQSQFTRPGFRGPLSARKTTPGSFRLHSNHATCARNTSIPFTLELIDGSKIHEEGTRNIGAWQEDDKLFELSDKPAWFGSRFKPFGWC